MTRIAKAQKRKSLNPKKRKVNLSKKTGPKKENLESGYRVHINAANSNPTQTVFIPKMSGR